MVKSNIIKSLDHELKQATFVVLVPDEVDLHGDIYDEITVRKAAHSFNISCRKANLFHVAFTNSFDFAESYISPVDMEIEGHVIKKGTWLVTIQCNNDDLWEQIKNGKIKSVSIGALGRGEFLNDDTD
jgi:Putative phage serine protease XkdF